jgi:hypothetical protein
MAIAPHLLYQAKRAIALGGTVIMNYYHRDKMVVVFLMNLQGFVQKENRI